MGKQFARIEPGHRAFIEQQRIFFVASAPPKGRVNVSPKGLSSIRRTTSPTSIAPAAAARPART
jgi:predicted pyridoxine 5'-phosphate oxidase superfamily flavin-nucleotide-binding protein